MRNRLPATCSCGHELSRPIPKICPNCQAEITRIVHSRSGGWFPVILVVAMFGTLLGLIIFLGTYL